MSTNRAQVAGIAAQIGSVLMVDNAVWTNRFQIVSPSSGKRYIIAQRKTDNVWGCECVGWIHHRKCKHLKDVLARLAAVATRALNSDRLDIEVKALLISAVQAYQALDIDNVKAVKTVQMKPLSRVLDLD
jgi:hypothetical protein